MKENKSNIESKELSITKIVYLVIFMLIIGMVILLGSDTFKTPNVTETKPNIPQQTNADPHAGADLSQLQKIMEIEDQLEAQPGNSDLVLQLGHLLNDSGFYEKAIDRYKEYLKDHPKETDVMVDMGVCYYQLGNYKSAISTMESALLIEPNHQIGNFNLGIVNLSAGNHDIALDYWKKAVVINPNSDIGKKAKSLIEQH